MDELKICTVCRIAKPHGEFARRKGYKDGLKSWCKVCTYEKQKVWREANPEKRKAIARRAASTVQAGINRRANRQRIKKVTGKPFQKEYMAGWRARKTAADPDFKRREHLKHLYRTTPEQYDAKLAAQGGVCAICKGKSGDIRLAVDHDHGCCSTRRSCGKCLRGLICSRCNNLLGHSKESIPTLLSAIEYLKKYVAV